MSFKRFLVFVLLILILLATIPHVRIAFTLGTGIGISYLQGKIKKVQSRAIKNQVTEDDKNFLKTFYRTMAYGAQLVLVLPESARLMHHYLDRSGSKTSVKVSLYKRSPRVKRQMSKIRRNITKNCKEGLSINSPRFEMGHGTPLDAHFALYFGIIRGVLKVNNTNQFIQWTTTMPWKWPTYKTLMATYGSYYKEIFPLPNILSLVGLGHPLWLPNGLGGELEKQGLAKSFEIITIWTESVKC